MNCTTMNLSRFPRLLLLAAAAVAVPLTATGAPLWQIGSADGSPAGLALAAEGHEHFKKPGFFVVGESDSATDWPFILPGPDDAAWAPGGPHTFLVWFALQTLPTGDSTLVLNLADTHNHAPPKLRIAINDRVVDYATPAGAGNYQKPAQGTAHSARITVAAGDLKVGVNRVAITVSRGSWLIWDHLAFEAGPGATAGKVADHSATSIEDLGVGPELFWKDGKKVRHIQAEIVHFGPPVTAGLSAGGTRARIQLTRGVNRAVIAVPDVSEPTKLVVNLHLGAKVAASAAVEIAPAREWTIHLVHQTHLDIGYTHVQEEVLATQVRYFREALALIEKTRAYPEGARFIWHPEGMWAVDEFMRVATEDERAAFLKACRERSIHLDVLYAQAMSGIYSEEELMELMAAAKRFAREHGVTIDSAMQSDVPGYTWGLASTLAANGVRHISLGPNAGHRVGHTFHWGDRPFYWETPDGKDKVLFWMAGKGYSMFQRSGVGGYGGLENNQLLRYIHEVHGYLRQLEQNDYPYDMVMLRYSIGSDNGPPDPTLCDAVVEWNKAHASPRIIIDSNSNFLRAFEQRYGHTLPTMRGDFTPYWEDGAASTSVATATCRRAAERLAQAQVLWSMKNPGLALHERFDTAWHKLIMFDEHTWGAHNSISAPDSQFAIRQDEYKQAYAFDGARLTDELLAEIAPARAGSPAIDIHNTASWTRGGLVILAAGQSPTGDLVRDESGQPVPSQRLASGELAIMASNIPAFGTRRFTIHPGAPAPGGAAKAVGNQLSNGLLEAAIDPKSGAISSLRRKDGGEFEWVDSSSAAGLNDYLYILGRDPNKSRATITGPVTVAIEDAGPLVATLRVESAAPGAAGLVRRVRLIDGQDHLELINTVDKLKIRKPEGVYFGFPFNLPGAKPRVDTPWATVEVETEQLPGANRNFYCVQRFVDLAGDGRGVTWVTVDAPLVQFDPIRIAPAWGPAAFREFIDPPPFLWSWTMNNHWETNYKADQEGKITFHYALRPYTGAYNEAAAQHFGRNICQPLLAVPSAPDHKPAQPMLVLKSADTVIATQVRPSRDGKAWMVRLFNTGDQPATVDLTWNRPAGQTWLSNPMEDALEPAPDKLATAARGFVTLRVERPTETTSATGSQ